MGVSAIILAAALPVFDFATNSIARRVEESDPAVCLSLYNDYPKCFARRDHSSLNRRFWLKGVDFRNGKRSFSANVRCGAAPAAIEVHLDSVDGPLAGTLQLKDTAGRFKTQSCSIRTLSGVHDLFFVFKGGEAGDLFEWDWWSIR